MSTTARKKMTAARTSMVLEDPFFGVLALSLPLVEDPTCKTAWTNGAALGYNPAFIEGLTVPQIKALVAHEVEHVAMGHPWRRDGRSMKHWNIAGDKAINHDLREAGYILPPKALYAEGDEKGKSAEWIFARLDRSNDDQPGGDSEPDPLGEVRDAPTGVDADGEPVPTEQDWKQKVQQAAVQAKMQGKLPGGLARNVEQALKPKTDVKSLLLRFFSERSTGDYSWTRPNPRYLHMGLYLPALESKSLGQVAIMVDTSGSVDAEDLRFARGVVQDVLDECEPAGVSLYFADAAVCHVQKMDKGEPLTWTPKGGGGTNFIPALKAMEDADEVPVCAICITDLEGTFPPQAPGIPVLWLATTDHIAPFGETVRLEQ